MASFGVQRLVSVLRLPTSRLHIHVRAASRILAGPMLVSIIAQLAVMVSGVLVARMLGVDNRGYLALFVLFPTVLAQLGSLGLPLAATYYIAREPLLAWGISRRLLLPSLLQVGVLLLIHAAVLWVFLRDQAPSLRFVGMITLIAVPAMLAQQYGLAILQGQRQFRPFFMLKLLPTVLYGIAVLGIFFVGARGLPLVAALWAGSLAVTAAAILVVARLGLGVSRRSSGQHPPPPLPTMVRFGMTAMLGSASPVETFRIDQAVAGLFLSPAALGLYVVGASFTNLPRTVSNCIGMIAYPEVAGQSDPQAARRAIGKYFWLTTTVCALLVLSLMAVSGLAVPFFFGAPFQDAVPITRLLLLNSLLWSMRRVLSDGARGAGDPRAGTFSEIASWLILLPALVVLTPRWGLEGVAIALLVSSLGSMIPFVGLLRVNSPLPGVSSSLIRHAHPRTFANLWRRLRPRRPPLPSHSVTLISIAALATVLAGIAIALISPSTSPILLALISATLLVPIVLRLYQRRFDPFEPISLFVLAYAVMFVIRPAVMLTNNELIYARPTKTVDVTGEFNQALFFALIGAISFCVIYLTNIGRFIARRIKAPPAQYFTETVVSASLLTIALAMACFLLILFSIGGIETIGLFLAGRSLDLRRVLQGSSYLWHATFMIVPGTIILLSVARERRLLGLLILALIFLPIVVLRGGSVGSRILLLPFVTGLIVYYYTTKGKRPGLAIILPALVVALIASSFLMQFRSSALRQEYGPVDLLLADIKHPTRIFEPLTEGEDAAMAPLFAAALQVVPSEVPLMYGRATVGEFFVRAIPRSLWPEKPLAPREQITAILWPQEYYNGVANLEYSVLLHFWLDFGVVGVIVGMGVYGAMARALYEFYLMHEDNTAVRLIFATSLAFVVIGLRDGPVDTVVRAAFVVCPIWAIFWLGGRETRRQPVTSGSHSMA